MRKRCKSPRYAEGQRRRWQNASPEVRAEKSKVSSKNSKRFWETVSDEKRAEMSEKNSQRNKQYWASMSAEEKERRRELARKSALGRRHTEAAKAKISQRTRELHEEGVLGSHSGMKGKQHSEATKKNMRRIQKSIDRTTPKFLASFAKHSEVMAEKIARGDFWDRGSYYSFKNDCELPYQSSYEMQAFRILDNMTAVFGFQRCPFRIPYKWPDGTAHRFVPDILVEWHDGMLEVIEVKSEHPFEGPEVLALKLEAGEKYCHKKGILFNVWTENELGLKVA